MEIHRAIDDDKNTWLPTSTIRNPRLSLDAVGLLMRLLSDGERFETVRDLAEHKGRGDFEIAEAAAQELTAEGHMRFGERTEVWAVPFGWEIVASLTGDERAQLELVANSPTPLSTVEVRDALLPMPAGRDGRSREHRLWSERADALDDAWFGLWNAGLIWESVPADGEHAGRCEITALGREALAAADSSRTEGAS